MGSATNVTMNGYLCVEVSIKKTKAGSSLGICFKDNGIVSQRNSGLKFVQ
jgi:hypothetical protein